MLGMFLAANLDFIKFPHARICGSAVALCVCRLLSCLLFSTPTQFFRAAHQLTCYMQPNCHLGPLCECPRVGGKRIYQSNHMILFSYIFEKHLTLPLAFFFLFQIDSAMNEWDGLAMPTACTNNWRYEKSWNVGGHTVMNRNPRTQQLEGKASIRKGKLFSLSSSSFKLRSLVL